MGDRTPDTSVLDRDEPPTEPSSAEREQGTSAGVTESGQPSGEPTSKPARVQPTDEAAGSDKPEDTAEPEDSTEPGGSAGPEDTAGPKAEEQPGAQGDSEGAEQAEGSEAAEGPTPPTSTADERDDAEAADDDAPSAEDDSAQPDESAGTDAGSDSTASDEAAAEEDDAEPGDAEPGDAAEPATGVGDTEPDEVAPPEPSPKESSESTRTVALRMKKDVPGSDMTMALSVKDVPGSDMTMALSVKDLPRVDPPAPPAAPQDTRPVQEPKAAPPPASNPPVPVPRPPASPPTATPPPPPASPIDLLAQLTNTPPPPNTATRTVLRRARIWSPVVALLALVVLVVQWVRPLPEPALVVDAGAASFAVGGDAFSMPWPEQGQAAVMVAGSGGIGTFGEQKPVPTASVAKIMTAYVILHGHSLKKGEPGPDVRVDARAVAEGRSKSESRIEGLRVGQRFSLQDMLKMLMIPSGNNVARLLARWDTGTGDEAAFVRKMNEAAKSLGMTNTTYTDPSGLDKGTVSTAVDQLRLAEAVMRFDSFRAVVAMPNADIPGVGRIYNNNNLIMEPGLSVAGIKTGSNTPAGGTLSWAAYKTVDGKDRLILGTLMDQHVTGPDPDGANSLKLVLKNSHKVIQAVREALTAATAVRKGQVVGHVDDGLGGRTPVVATRDLKVVGIPGQKLTFTFREGEADIVGGMKAGTVVGQLTLDGVAGAESVPVALQSELAEPSVGAKLTRIG
ncbi:serine hydrolase [Streptomyces sp. M41]|uniref:D-alanyl-D-alanine carboxypeptidase n=1 Tax=Streptomyces sp. M41 TaxID=3059412 RepID=UPI00374CB9AD